MAYAAAGILIAVAYGVGATAARRMGGTRGLWLTASSAVVLLALIGALDWSRQPVKGTPLHTYVLVAVVPTLLTAIAVHALAARGVPFALQAAVGVLVWLAVGWATLFTGFYP